MTFLTVNKLPRVSEPPRMKKPLTSQGFTSSEAPPGFEPGVEVLQTSALPLGYGALAGRIPIISEPDKRNKPVFRETDSRRLVSGDPR
jgi:hypothetical protein